MNDATIAAVITLVERGLRIAAGFLTGDPTMSPSEAIDRVEQMLARVAAQEQREREVLLRGRGDDG